MGSCKAWQLVKEFAEEQLLALWELLAELEHGLGKRPWTAGYELTACWGELGSAGCKQERLAGTCRSRVTGRGLV